MSPCARCGYAANATDVCAQCGVILAKARPQSAPSAAAPMDWPLRIHITLPRHMVLLLMTFMVASVALWRIGWRPWHFKPSAVSWDATALRVDADPNQEPFTEPQKPRVLHARGQTIVLEPRATYRIAGRIVAQDEFYTDVLATVAPVDLTLAWGPLLTPEALSEVQFGHFARFGTFRTRANGKFNRDLISQHMSNNHLIPATDRVRAVLAALSVGDVVELSGELVDVSMTSGQQMLTSRSRTDIGAGACEIIYVMQVRQGDRVWR